MAGIKLLEEVYKMVRKCVYDDLNQMIELAFRKNNDASHFSEFCPCKRDKIQEEFTEELNSKDNIYVGYFEQDVLKGLLFCYINNEINNADCGGPFVDGDFNKISKEMFEYMKSLLSPSIRYTFYFGKRNAECISFMESIEAENQGNEFQLQLKKENYKKIVSSIQVNVLPAEYTNQFIKLHDTIWPNVYISGKGIIKSIGADRQIFCAINDSKLIGYSVLKTYKNSQNVTAEVISVDENYRHKGYGRALLNKLLEVALSNATVKTVDLIVDKVNENALALYYSMGFEPYIENCCYIAK